MDKTGIICPGKPFHPARGVEHKWSEGSMFHVKNSLFIGPLLLLLALVAEFKGRPRVGVEHLNVKNTH